MTSKHTPGPYPWSAEAWSGLADDIELHDGFGDADQRHKLRRQVKAIIAEAPAMLEALRACVAAIDGMEAQRIKPLQDYAAKAREEARTILARIDGKE